MTERLAHILRRYRFAFGAAVVLAVMALGFAALHHLLSEVHAADVREAYHAIGGWRIAAALGLTAVSYVTLTFYDVLALRVIGRPLPYRTAAFASFTSYTLSHNLGMALLTGGSARYRIYAAAGLDGSDVVRIIATASFTFWTGVFAMAGAALALNSAPWNLPVPDGIQRLIGVLIVISVALLLFARGDKMRTLSIFGWQLPLPSRGQGMAQLGIAALDLAAASAALFVLVPEASVTDFPVFFLAYAVAIIAALVSHVPGGIGIFEAIIIATLPTANKPSLLAALIVYRLVYYLLPLAIAAMLLVVSEGQRWRRLLPAAQAVASTVAPLVVSALVLIGGAILLVSGSLPATPERIGALRDFVPLPFVEASHIAASLVGTLLLFLAPGLYRRLDGAFVATRALLLLGAFFSLARGFDIVEASVLLTIAILLHSTRSAFYRRTALTTAILSPPWLVAVLTSLALAFWIGLFSYKHVAYSGELWWQFVWSGDASRFLRASFAVAVLVVAILLARLFGPARPVVSSDEPTLEDVLPVLGRATRTDAMLAFSGDKRFMTTPERDAFLMYQVQGRSWIVMSDPVGPPGEWRELLWRVRELSDAHQGRLLLYQISPEAMPIAVDLGLNLVKYGEEARVDLEQFSLEGPKLRTLRHAERRAARDDAEFSIIPASGVPAIMEELRSISDDWLAEKGQAEKAFSVGRFDPDYLARFDCAVVRREGRIVAFANIWATGDGQELSIDLMRHNAAAPRNAMDFLFVHLMQWGKERGYRWFSLGLAPLSGLEARRLAPLWAKAGAFLFHHGETLYGFEGLRAYKEKFSPVWTPRYIAGPFGLAMAQSMLDLQFLVSGGKKSAAVRFRSEVMHSLDEMRAP